MKREFNLSLEKVIPYLKRELRKLQQDPDRTQLQKLSPDDAYDLGYKACILDVEMLMGADPKETLQMLNNDVAEEERKVTNAD